MSTAIDGTGGSSTSGGRDRGFFGHPRGLSTLFFTEMWERFSYYGMRAILTLYMTKTLVEGGLGFDEKYASLIYATYVSSVWYLPLIGGWLADKIFGARRAVLIGHQHQGKLLCRSRTNRLWHGPAETEHQRHGGPTVFAGR